LYCNHLSFVFFFSFSFFFSSFNSSFLPSFSLIMSNPALPLPIALPPSIAVEVVPPVRPPRPPDFSKLQVWIIFLFPLHKEESEVTSQFCCCCFCDMKKGEWLNGLSCERFDRGCDFVAEAQVVGFQEDSFNNFFVSSEMDLQLFSSLLEPCHPSAHCCGPLEVK